MTIEVVAPGTQTTVQDLPGRQGMWGVGVPPSGAWDDLSFSLANTAVGNPPGTAGLEAVLRGPVLRFDVPTLVCVAGAARLSTVDGVPLAPGCPQWMDPGQVLDVGPIKGPGLRAYVAVAGGIDVPQTLGSRSTFLLGGFGGLDGRPLRRGDRLPVGTPLGEPTPVRLPELTHDWTVRVIPGPHGAPEYLTEAGVRALFATEWHLDHRSDRTGVRLVADGSAGNGMARDGVAGNGLAGNGLEFARGDGGDAGLHPSNIHDSAYPVGGIMLSGTTPVIVGPDGPSLGGFVVPAVVVRADRWKLAQCRPGDRIRLVPAPDGRPGPLAEVAPDGERPALTVRPAGDHHVLVEVGPPELDLAVRLQVHLLARELGTPDGVVESVEGVRSLLLAVDEDRLPLPTLADAVAQTWQRLPALSTVELPAREVYLPIAFDDPAAHEAMTRYQTSVRPDAPWCPDNVEFIRRINGLAERHEVFDIVAAATYLVVGLGDVYLGAPVAVPLDPAHRLVTTKYDPPRTWTPANAVGIGGTYLCVYGMEGPGGYQLVGRTVPVWRTGGDPPWLLRPFDLLRFHPVSPAELLDLRADLAAGRRELVTRPVTLTLADLLPPVGPEAREFLARRRAAFAEERDRWALTTGVPA